MARVLFLPAGIGLAHTGRLITIAKELQTYGIEVMFGAGGDAKSMIRRERLLFMPLVEFDRSIYERKLKKGNPFIYTKSIIEKFVAEELELYRQVKPTIVVYDMRLTAKISAQIAKIPTVSVNNVDATPYYDFSQIKFPASTTLIKYLPKKLVQVLNRKYGRKFLKVLGPQILQAILFTILARHSVTLFKLGYKFGKSPYQFFLGDLTLIADIPKFRPVKELPQNVKMVGPIFWNAEEIPLPKWHKNIDNRDKIIYVTASGTGDKSIFIKILSYLKETDYTIVATTGNTLQPSEVTFSYPKLFITDYLPGSWIMPKAKLVIFPGGNASVYQALSYGVPQVCTPLHIDQEDNANQVERLETGKVLNPYTNFSKDVFLAVVSEVVENPKYRQNAGRMKEILRKYDGKRKAAEEIKKFMIQ